MALPIGVRVRLLPPFDESFPREYTTIEHQLEEGEEYQPTLNWLDGAPGAFDDLYLEQVA